MVAGLLVEPGGTFSFKDSYEGGIALFDGAATDEVYFTRSECHITDGKCFGRR